MTPTRAYVSLARTKRASASEVTLCGSGLFSRLQSTVAHFSELEHALLIAGYLGWRWSGFQVIEEDEVLKRLFAAVVIVSLISGCGSRGQGTNTPAPTQVAGATQMRATDVPPAETPMPTATGAPATSSVPPISTPVQPMATPEASAQGFLLEDVGFETPESVLYDPKADVYLVANINGLPSDKDGNGFISRISPEGEVLALKWIDGAAESAAPSRLHAPKGMALAGDRLYVADIDVVRVYDRESGGWLDEIPVQGARFLNDVAAGQDGTVYVTDTGSGVVHRIRPDGSLERAGQTKSPNGIQVRGDTVLVTGGSNQVFRLGDHGELSAEYEAPAGGLDGLVLLNDGSVLVSSWMGSAVYQFSADGRVTELFSGIKAPADIGLDTKRNVVLIPHFEDDRVEARPLSSAVTSPADETSTRSPTPTVVSFAISGDVPYIDDGQRYHKLDIYLPAQGDRPFPTLVVMHGGGRDKRDLAHWARHFAEQGYAVVPINYRDVNLFDYPAPVQDAFCALAWAHANAEAYGFDARRIVAMGHSAGGTLTAMLGTVDDPGLFSGDCPYELPKADWIQGAIPFTGIFDYVKAVESSPQRRSRDERYLGAELKRAPEIWAQASAATWVDGSEPPFLLVHGAKDSTIEPEQSVSFAEILQLAGVDAELLIIADVDHGGIVHSEEAFKSVEDFLGTLH